MSTWAFVENELITSSILAAFRRGGVYAERTAEKDPNRGRLRERLAVLLREISSQYKVAVTPERHNKNIQKIADDLTRAFGDKKLLRGDRFRIGTAQKALNLYLKYLWCLDRVATPPHCPFDDGIIARLPLTDQEKRELRWTELDSIRGSLMLP